MVLTIGPLASPSYYLDRLENKTDPGIGREPPDGGFESVGTWWNPSRLFDIPDMGKVSRSDLEHLHRGFAPDGHTRLTRNAGSLKRKPGKDLGFNADKTVSALWAIADPEMRRQIEAAHADAVRTAMPIVEQFMGIVALRERGLEPVGISADIMAAVFHHGANRDGEPHLHTHCLVFNFGRARLDGKFRAMTYNSRDDWLKLAGATYRNALAWNLQERISVRAEPREPDGQFMELAGIPEELVSFWSKRQDKVIKASRGRKRRRASWTVPSDNSRDDEDPEARHRRWRAECDALGIRPEGVVALSTGWSSDWRDERLRELPELLDKLPAEITRDRVYVPFADIVARVEQITVGLCDRNGVQDCVTRVFGTDYLTGCFRDPSGADIPEDQANLRFTPQSTTATIQAIADISRDLAEDPGFSIPERPVETRIDTLLAGHQPGIRHEINPPILDQQVEVIRKVAAEGRLFVVEALPGPERTVAIKIIADLHAEQGCVAFGTAVDRDAVRSLGDAAGIRAYGIERVLQEKTWSGFKTGNLLLFADQVEELSPFELHRLLSIAQKREARVVLLMERDVRPAHIDGIRAKVPSIRIGWSYRQKPEFKEILRFVRDVPDDEARIQSLLVTDREKAPTVALHRELWSGEDPNAISWQACAALSFENNDIRKGISAYDDRGRFHTFENLENCLKALVADWAQCRCEWPEHTTVALARTEAEVSVLSWILREYNLGDPRQRICFQFPVRSYKTGETREAMEVAVGDLLRVDVSFDVRHGVLPKDTILTVEDLCTLPGNPDPRVFITARTQDGHQVTFSHDEVKDSWGLPGLRHGYAMKIAHTRNFAADRILLLADGRFTREDIAQAARLHRDSLDVYVNETEILQQIEFEHSEFTVKDRTDLLEFLAQRWSGELPRQTFLSKYADSGCRTNHIPDGSSTGNWVASHDSGNGKLKAIGCEMRHARKVMRHGETIRTLAAARAEVSKDQQILGDLAKRNGVSIAASAPFVQTLNRHKALIRDTDELLSQNRFSLAFLKEQGGISLADIEDFRHLYREARRLHRSVLAQGLGPGDQRIVLSSDSLVREARAHYSQIRQDWRLFFRKNSLLGAIYDPDFANLAERTTALVENPHLDENLRRGLGDFLVKLCDASADRDYVRHFLRDLSESAKRFKALDSVAKLTETRFHDLTGARLWLKNADLLIASGRAILNDEDHYGIHLERAGSRLEVIAAAVSELEALRVPAPAHEIEEVRELVLSHGISL